VFQFYAMYVTEPVLSQEFLRFFLGHGLFSSSLPAVALSA